MDTVRQQVYDQVERNRFNATFKLKPGGISRGQVGNAPTRPTERSSNDRELI